MKELFNREVTKSVDVGRGARFTATFKLHKLDGNKDAYFSATGEERKHGRAEAFGCLHDEIREHFPEWQPFVDLHLCGTDGAPMHAVENAVYWAGGTKWQEADQKILASHLRINEQEASLLISQVAMSETRSQKTLVVSDYVEKLRDRWKQEAQAQIQRLADNLADAA